MVLSSLKEKYSTAYLITSTYKDKTYKENIITPSTATNDTFSVLVSVDGHHGGTTAIGVIIMDDDKTKPASGVTVQFIETASQSNAKHSYCS
jgi:hypothetical protein